MSIDATVGGATANSYLDVTAFKALATTRTNVPTASDADIATALMAATARLEQEHYVGYRTNPAAQALKWPRVPIMDDDGWLYDPQTIPAPVLQATTDLAIELLRDATFLDRSGLLQFESLTVGPIDLKPKMAALAPGQLPASTMRWLSPFRQGGNQAQIIRG